MCSRGSEYGNALECAIHTVSRDTQSSIFTKDEYGIHFNVRHAFARFNDPEVLMNEVQFPNDSIHRVTTADGSATLHHPRYAQTYHSHHGALSETRHVFLGLSGLAARMESSEPHVLEVGVGTGLNTVATLSLAESLGKVVHYTGIEREPQPASLLATLEFASLEGISADVWNAFLDAIEHRKAKVVTPSGSTMSFHWGDFDDFDFKEESYDVIFHDGFSPEMNPELWSQEALSKLARTLKLEGNLVTYTVQGNVRRALAQAGLAVEKLPGPENGKREVLRATKK